MRNPSIGLVDLFQIRPMKSAYSAIHGFDWVLVSRVVCFIQIFSICPLRVCNPYVTYVIFDQWGSQSYHTFIIFIFIRKCEIFCIPNFHNVFERQLSAIIFSNFSNYLRWLEPFKKLCASKDQGGLWVLNVCNIYIQAIQSDFYLLHDKFFEIISKIFGPPTVNGSIEHKTVVKLLTVNDIWCLTFVLNQGKLWHIYCIQMWCNCQELYSCLTLFHILNFRSNSLEKFVVFAQS
jgi:hypothetical protein